LDEASTFVVHSLASLLSGKAKGRGPAAPAGAAAAAAAIATAAGQAAAAATSDAAECGCGTAGAGDPYTKLNQWTDHSAADTDARRCKGGFGVGGGCCGGGCGGCGGSRWINSGSPFCRGCCS